MFLGFGILGPTVFTCFGAFCKRRQVRFWACSNPGSIGDLVIWYAYPFWSRSLISSRYWCLFYQGVLVRRGGWHTDLENITEGFGITCRAENLCASFRSALPTNHAYRCEYDQAELSGCVYEQFMRVRHNLAATKILKWFPERGV